MEARTSNLKRINKLAVPILLTYVTNLMFTLGDQAIIGRTSLNGYAAVSVVSNLLYALTGTLGILALSLNIIGSKLLGEKDNDGYESLFNTAITISIIIGVVFEIVSLIFGKSILMYAFNMDGDMLKKGYAYLSISGIGLGLNMIIFIFSAYFKNIEKTDILFKASIISSVVNLGIDYVLVFGKLGFPELGVMGAAIGTVAGLFVHILISLIGIKKYSNFVYTFKVKKEYFGKLIKSYVSLLGQDFVESTAFVFVITSIITSLGTLSIGAYNIINVILNIMVLPIYAYSNSALTIVAKARSEKDYQLQRDVPVTAIKILMVILIPIGIVIMINPRLFLRIITNENQLIVAASKIIYLAIIIQLANVTKLIYNYLLNAIEDEKWVLSYYIIVSVISLTVIYYMATYFGLGLKGVFYGLGINHILLTIGFSIRYYQKCNENNSIIEEV